MRIVLSIDDDTPGAVELIDEAFRLASDFDDEATVEVLLD